jgi:hypothetical protein
LAVLELPPEVVHLQRVELETLRVQVLERALDSSWDLWRRDNEDEASTFQSRCEIPDDRISSCDSDRLIVAL